MTMTFDIDGKPVIVFAPEPSDNCQLCGKLAELRPYGPNGERICFECGMAMEPTTSKMFAKVLFGDAKAEDGSIAAFPRPRPNVEKGGTEK